MLAPPRGAVRRPRRSWAWGSVGLASNLGERALGEVEQLLVLFVVVLGGAGKPADLFRQGKDLPGELEQLLVLALLLLNRLPLLVGEHLALRVGPVLADHHEGREEDRFERDDHRQQAEGVLLDAEADPQAEP